MNIKKHINIPVLVLVGPTAIGKTDLSLHIAERYGCEIISMDSMQVYRYMDIGTAKVSKGEQERVPHHLIDIRNPDQQYDAAQFVDDCIRVIEKLEAGGKIPLITGGTGMYLASLTQGLFSSVAVPEAVRQAVQQKLQEQGREALYTELQTIDRDTANRIHINDTQRLLRAWEIYEATGIPWSEHKKRQQKEQGRATTFAKLKIIGLTCERSVLYERIALRSSIMLEQGMIDEVETLLAMGYDDQLPSMQAIGYRHILGYINGQTSLSQTQEELIRDTRRYAKRQMTWFKKTAGLKWFDRENRQEVTDAVDRFLDTPSE
ncbi:tRNA (adenosine(37)-N6)-dimethylallyltransferase MiaA [Desulfogranum japonicum]|uniref:tRNA (adenosine(37)-N6)-dimethylallyltransferase MiaA n=1 Tax=Desulfogranum japonicum TaxID=231447 RepID=UPI000554F707|nr:tRNA (adenosine(37)-N6)-dimethylallyltransferase MiaA [Desulfogranum japonicum]